MKRRFQFRGSAPSAAGANCQRRAATTASLLKYGEPPGSGVPSATLPFQLEVWEIGVPSQSRLDASPGTGCLRHGSSVKGRTTKGYVAVGQFGADFVKANTCLACTRGCAIGYHC